MADLSALIQPYIRFLFVGSELCPLLISRNNIRLPSDSTSRWTPLPSANASCYRARSGLSPPSYRPCWAHQKMEKPNFVKSDFSTFRICRSRHIRFANEQSKRHELVIGSCLLAYSFFVYSCIALNCFVQSIDC